MILLHGALQNQVPGTPTSNAEPQHLEAHSNMKLFLAACFICL